MTKIKNNKKLEELTLSDLVFLIWNGKIRIILITLICVSLSFSLSYLVKKIYTVEKLIIQLSENEQNTFLNALNRDTEQELVYLDINIFTKKEMFANFYSTLKTINYSEKFINTISRAINFKGNKEEKYNLYRSIISSLKIEKNKEEEINVSIKWHDYNDGNKILNEIIKYKLTQTLNYFDNLSQTQIYNALASLISKKNYFERREEQNIKFLIKDLEMNI